MRSFTSYIVALVLSSASAVTADVTVPSGQELALYDVVLEADTSTARFRFLAPQIAQDAEALTYADVEADFSHLCTVYALPALLENEWDARSVVITLSDREVEFGVITPEATQIFEAFSVENGLCIWEQF
ncbi:DUF6497 family protein [Thalassobium sp. R2A62]|uniref:DUF6497 family protein n=1 Tax=Thalassobium sp. R2A62 TaxID=633131 RepID=UPI001231D415|nr:DUF6497 family protein [Thalassobium sp. R2A62]